MTHPVLCNSICRPSTTLIDRVCYPVNVKVIAIVSKLRTDADLSGIIGRFVGARCVSRAVTIYWNQSAGYIYDITEHAT